jgi:hypothetical protein
MGQITISGKVFEIYGTLAAASDYFLASLSASTGWSDAASGDRQKALITASRMFERTFWVGEPTDPVTKEQPQPADTQPLQWPRTGVTDVDGSAVPDTEIPESILFGAYELANALLVTDNTVESTANSGSNLKSDLLTEKVDVLSTTTKQEWFTPTGAGAGNAAPRFPTAVHEYIRTFLSGGASGTIVGATGLWDSSAFDDDWGLNP